VSRAGWLAACVGLAASIDGTGTGAELRGRVLTLLGDPLAGASVSLEKGLTERRSAVTQQDGTFFLGALTPGQWQLTTRLAGFAEESRTVSLPEASSPWIDIGLVVFKLTDIEPCEFEGMVRAPDATAIEGTSVSLIAAFNDRIRATASTDPAGRYRLRVEEPAQYVLYGFKPGFSVTAIVVTCQPLLPRPRIRQDLTLVPLRPGR